MVSDMAADLRAKQASAERATDLALPPRLRAILEAEYPRFSDAEMARRRAAIGNLIPDALFVQHINHVPLARRLAAPAEVAWGGGSSIAAAVAALQRRGARADRVGVIGPMTFEPRRL